MRGGVSVGELELCDLGDLGELAHALAFLALRRGHLGVLCIEALAPHVPRTRLDALLEVGDHLRRRLQQPKEVFQVSVVLLVLLPLLMLARSLVKDLVIS